VSLLRAESPPAVPSLARGTLRYVLALATILGIVAVRLLLAPVLEESAFFLFPLTVFVVSWRLGLGPGLLATAIAAAAGWIFFLDPRLAPAQRGIHVTVFLCQAALTSAVAWYLQRLHGERLRADRHAASFLDKVEDGFFAVDAEWRFTYVNRHVRSYSRGPEDGMIGRVLWEVYPELNETEVEREYRRVMTERVSLRFETRSYISDRWFRIYAYPFEDGIAVFSTDLSDRQKAEEEVRRAKEEAETASRMKDQFLATLSHELRTPLNAILGWVQILRSGRMDEAGMRRGLETIERSSRAQAQLIDDLLDVSRIISGKLRLDLRPVDLPEIVDAALATVAPAAEAKGIRIEKSYAPPPGIVSGDPERLQQVVWNLLSNAVKFTPRGGCVEISLQAGQAGQAGPAEDDAHAEIRIADTGQGIRPDFLPFVFDPFRQADSSTTRRQGGLGLGLSIVRQMVEMHGGSVRAESAGEGHGSVFTVALPLAAGSPRPGPEEPVPVPAKLDAGRPASLRGLRLLVVDDDADTRDLLRHVLTDRGAQVETAASVADALALLESETSRPDLLVSDIGMPGRDGFDLIREVRERWPPAALPAVALTAFARAEDRHRALAAGYQAHLAKPFDAAELAATVARLAGER
jgi:signal transduction histidine kinase/ActR/RegA family two-component response regulator